MYLPTYASILYDSKSAYETHFKWRDYPNSNKQYFILPLKVTLSLPDT